MSQDELESRIFNLFEAQQEKLKEQLGHWFSESSELLAKACHQSRTLPVPNATPLQEVSRPLQSKLIQPRDLSDYEESSANQEDQRNSDFREGTETVCCVDAVDTQVISGALRSKVNGVATKHVLLELEEDSADSYMLSYAVPGEGLNMAASKSMMTTIPTSPLGKQISKGADWVSEKLEENKERKKRISQQLSVKSWHPVMEQAKEMELKSYGTMVYEGLVAALIVINTLWVGFQIQYQATSDAYDLEDAFQNVSMVFCICFFVELLVRMYLYYDQRLSLKWALQDFFVGRDYRWNVFDLIVVISSVADQAMYFASPDSESAVSGQMSVLRSVRLLRLLRIVRMFRMFSVFREFRLLIHSLLASIRALVWVIVVSLLIIYITATGITQGALEKCSGGQNSKSPECEHFGSLFVSMLSLFKATCGGIDWHIQFQALENVGMLYAVMLLVYIIFTLVVLFNVVTAIFIDIQIRVAAREKEDRMLDLVHEKNHLVETMSHVFCELDMNDNGTVSFDELQMALADRSMDSLLSTLKLEVHDAESLFFLLDQDGSDAVSIDQFVSGCIKLRGEAKSIDIALLRMQNEFMFAKVLELQDVLDSLDVARKAIDEDKKAERLHEAMVMGRGSITAALATQQFDMMPTSSRMSTKSVTRGKSMALRNPSNMNDFGRFSVADKSQVNYKRSIPQVEMRAMSLRELHTVRLIISERTELECWEDLMTKKDLEPEEVNLYSFNHYALCPMTVPAGVYLEVSADIDVHAGADVFQGHPNGSSFLAKGVVIEASNGKKIKVRVTEGKFQAKHSECHLGIGNEQSHEDQGEIVSVTAVGEDLSFKELLSSTPTKPTWFCSHWWGEPVFDFITCCKGHSQLRGLKETESYYWVCAYANRQHDLGADVTDDPEASSFRKAMKAAGGVLLILDNQATPFTRIWCDFEIYSTLTDEKTLDIVTQDPTQGVDAPPLLLSQLPLHDETPYWKSERDQAFPVDLLMKGISVRLEDGQASVSTDRENILHYMAKHIQQDRACSHLSIDEAVVLASRRANSALNAYFAQAAWPIAVKLGRLTDFDPTNPGSLNLQEVIRRDEERHNFTLSLAHMAEVTDAEMQRLAWALPDNLKELILSFEGCKNISDAGMKALAEAIPSGLTKLHLDFLGCSLLTDAGLKVLADNLPPALNELRLDFLTCEQIGFPGVRALASKLPPTLKKLTATFRGTGCNKNFASPKALKRMFKMK